MGQRKLRDLRELKLTVWFYTTEMVKQ